MVNIYGWEQKYKHNLEMLDKAKFPQSEKKLIKDFLEDSATQRSVKLPRLIKYARELRQLREMLGCNFKQAKDKDFRKLISKIDNKKTDHKGREKDASPYTKQDLKADLKVFYRWLTDDQLPRYLNKVKIKKLKTVIDSEKLVTFEEMERMIEKSIVPRNRCFLALLYETGARISSIAKLKYGDLKRVKHGFEITFKHSKIGTPFSDFLVYSAPLVAQYQKLHPTKKADDPFWFNLRTGEPEVLNYNTFNKILKTAGKKAGITTKRLNLHGIRHFRATELAQSGDMPEALLKQKMNWSQDSEMLGVYVHENKEKLFETIRSMNGIQKTEEEKKRVAEKRILCQGCGLTNSPKAEFCENCDRPLTLETALRIDTKRVKDRELFDQVAKMILTGKFANIQDLAKAVKSHKTRKRPRQVVSNKCLTAPGAVSEKNI